MTRKIVCAVCIILFTAAAFCADSSLAERYLNAANTELDSKNYAKAFNYINFVLGSYTEEQLPQNVEVMAETIYYSYLTEIRTKKDFAAFTEVKNKLLEFPILTSERIGRLVRTINTIESQDTAWGAPPPAGIPVPSISSGQTGTMPNPPQSGTGQSQPLTAEDLSEMLKNEQEQNNARQQQLLEAQKEAYETALSKNMETNKPVDISIIIAIVVTGIILVIIFAAVIVNIIVSLKNTKNQKDQFEETLKVVSLMNRSPRERMVLENMSDMYGENEHPLIEAGSTNGSILHETLPPPEMTEKEREQMKDLAAKCEKMGVEIDRVTGRKNNSKNIAEMVFKICHEMELGAFDSMLYFSVAMVYDTGFLLIDQNLLQAENLNDDEKYRIRGHVQLGLEQLDFVPERFKPVFIDGVLMHHENMDGSGYPEGLSGDQIPFIARIIHVVESFVSLISKRNYRTIYDKESAMEELKNHPELYDQTIVDTMDKFI